MWIEIKNPRLYGIFIIVYLPFLFDDFATATNNCFTINHKPIEWGINSTEKFYSMKVHNSLTTKWTYTNKVIKQQNVCWEPIIIKWVVIYKINKLEVGNLASTK